MPAIVLTVLLHFFPTPTAASIGQVAWLRGCWESTTDQGVIEEHWTAPRGRTMLAVGRTLRGDSVVEHEYVMLREQAGKLHYEAHPSGQEPATFTTPAASDTMVVFENPAHDFPQRVGYRRSGADSLVAWIDGTVNGQPRRVEFPYRRMSCTGGA